MKKTIRLAPNFPLPLEVVTESIAIMGRKGGGKTYTGGKLFEEMHGVALRKKHLLSGNHWMRWNWQ